MPGTRVLFVDLDGTVRHGKAELGRYVNTPADVVPFRQATAQMRAWREAGGVVIGITNQGGVGLGHITRATHAAINETTFIRAESQLDHIASCTHRPDAGCWCRKPLPGLIYDALLWVDLAGYGRPTSPAECLMVGDMDTDRQAASAAGVPFQWADEWRGKAPV